MQEYVKRLRQEFGGGAQLARFMGVSVRTIESWCGGARSPSGEAYRLLYVLGTMMVESPALFGAIVRPSKPALPNLPQLPELPVYVAPIPREPQWLTHPDAYWRPRTVTLRDWENGTYPEIEDPVAMLRVMTEEQEQAYCDSLADYCRVTGRLMPD